MSYRKKLIEVALPLDAINKASAHEKSIRHGHPSTLHLWWARRPLAACRAVLFASLIDDPSEHAERFPTTEQQEQERERLFDLIREMVEWEQANDEDVMKRVRDEINAATDGAPPAVLDPFAGGGSIPLEAQRLGLEAHASDLNPVAVLINKAMIEIPPKFAGCPPVNPQAPQTLLGGWHGARGLAEDIRYYGKWMRDEAERRIGHLYPKVTLPSEYGGGEATVIAWLWARTVTCPNPACGAQMPLVRSFYLSKKKGKETWVEPVVNLINFPATVDFVVQRGQPGKPQDGTINRNGARCVACGTAVTFDHIRREGRAGRVKAQLMAIVAEGQRERIYLTPTQEHTDITLEAESTNIPESCLPEQALGFRVQLYGMTKHCDLFTSRQLAALSTFSDLVKATRDRILVDIQQLSFDNNQYKYQMSDFDINMYANAIATYLAMAVDRSADFWSSLATWANQPKNELVAHTFTKQSLSMIWDFAEANPFCKSGGNFEGNLAFVIKSIQFLPHNTISGKVLLQSATDFFDTSTPLLISTDPPYYDNIGYADLSDFFYIWLRRSLQFIYPEILKTVLVPKSAELIATPFRFAGSKNKARIFFEEGLKRFFERIRSIQHSEYPLTVYYAFKQAESEIDSGNETEIEIRVRDDQNFVVTASTGWETMLEGLIHAGFIITGTWPMRTERPGRTRDIGSNALASSIVLVCRPRPVDAGLASRRQFLTALRSELPEALSRLQHGNIAPVDLAQASIGPGMAIYSRYSKVVESNGERLSVRTALQLINSTLDELLAEQEGEYDAETRWAIAWYEQFALEVAAYGTAETLSKAKNISVEALKRSGWLESTLGKVRLKKRDELPEWQAQLAEDITVWEAMQRLIYAVTEKGEVQAAKILRATGDKGEVARDLAYRLYTVCERKGWSQEALAYNSLVTSWPQISQLARREVPEQQIRQTSFI